MYAARGIGLAAPQIGQSLRVVVMDVEQNDNEEDVTEESREDRSTPAARVKPLVFINPEIVARSEEINVYQEGCLSIPGQYAESSVLLLSRSNSSTLTAKNSNRKLTVFLRPASSMKSITSTAFCSQTICHR